MEPAPEIATRDTPIAWAEDRVLGETTAERAARREGQFRASEHGRRQAAAVRRSWVIFAVVIVVVVVALGSVVGVHKHREREARARTVACPDGDHDGWIAGRMRGELLMSVPTVALVYPDRLAAKEAARQLSADLLALADNVDAPPAFWSKVVDGCTDDWYVLRRALAEAGETL